jgi:hypothetical protein
MQRHEKGPSESPKGLSPDPSPGPLSPEKKSCVSLFLFYVPSSPRTSTAIPLGLAYLFFALLFFFAFFAFFFAAMSTSCWKSEASYYRPISQARIPTTTPPPRASIRVARGTSQEKIGVLENIF